MPPYMRFLVAIAIVLCVIAYKCVFDEPEAAVTAGAESRATAILADMVGEDQRLRMDTTLDWGEVAAADARHRETVYELLADGSISTPKDLYNAAFILQHADPSSCRDCYLLASKLSRQAVELGHESARRMVALNLDRYLVFSGKPQKYGTQSNYDSLDVAYLFPVDPSTTDSERAEWGVAPLDSLKAAIARENAGE